LCPQSFVRRMEGVMGGDKLGDLGHQRPVRGANWTARMDIAVLLRTIGSSAYNAIVNWDWLCTVRCRHQELLIASLTADAVAELTLCAAQRRLAARAADENSL